MQNPFTLVKALRKLKTAEEVLAAAKAILEKYGEDSLEFVMPVLQDAIRELHVAHDDQREKALKFAASATTLAEVEILHMLSETAWVSFGAYEKVMELTSLQQDAFRRFNQYKAAYLLGNFDQNTEWQRQLWGLVHVMPTIDNFRLILVARTFVEDHQGDLETADEAVAAHVQMLRESLSADELWEIVSRSRESRGNLWAAKTLCFLLIDYPDASIRYLQGLTTFEKGDVSAWATAKLAEMNG